MQELTPFIAGYTRCVICGIGNTIRGDDAFGSLMAEKLAQQLAANPNVSVINCEETPERYTGEIIRLKPSHLIFVDAVNFAGKPGEVIIADPRDARGLSQSTHHLALKLLVTYIEGNIKTKYILIGCQPKTTELCAEMSMEVKAAMCHVEKMILKMISFSESS